METKIVHCTISLVLVAAFLNLFLLLQYFWTHLFWCPQFISYQPALLVLVFLLILVRVVSLVLNTPPSSSTRPSSSMRPRPSFYSSLNACFCVGRPGNFGRTHPCCQLFGHQGIIIAILSYKINSEKILGSIITMEI